MLEGRQVFVDIDTRRDFFEPTGALYVPDSTAIIPNLARLNRFASDRRRPGHRICPLPRRPGTEDIRTALHDRHSRAGAGPGDFLCPECDLRRAGTGALGRLPPHLPLLKRQYDLFTPSQCG